MQFYVSLQRPGFLHPLVSGSLLYGVRCSPLEYRIVEYLGRLLLEWFPYATLLGWTVDTCLASVYEALWKIFTRLGPRISVQCLVRQRIHVHCVRLWRLRCGSDVGSGWFALFVNISVVVQRQISMVRPVQETTDILQLQYTDKDVSCAGPALECRRGGASRALTVAARGGPVRVSW